MASQLFFEVHYDEKCAEKGGESSCFWIELAYNGRKMHFASCVEKNIEKGLDFLNCYFDDFLAYFDTIKVHENENELCLLPYFHHGI